jgi:hypothetical protein
MEIKDFEIYFSDLTEGAQKELLQYLGIERPEELNIDQFPIAVIQREDYEGTYDENGNYVGTAKPL